MVIHCISTINGQTNEGMRSLATQLCYALERQHTVLYSGLRQLPRSLYHTRQADVTLIFARANRAVHQLAHALLLLGKPVWLVLVQPPDAVFARHPLSCGYLGLTEYPPLHVHRFPVGIDSARFHPVSPARRAELKRRYRLDPEQPVLLHVGHCSVGRGLEDLCSLGGQRLVVASGLFKHQPTVDALRRSGVHLHTGYLPHVEDVYQLADAYFFPTRSTEYAIDIPLSVMEALACGVPVIGYRAFAGLGRIAAEPGAITLVDRVEEIPARLPEVLRRKAEHSLLRDPASWEQAADVILQQIGVSGR